MGVVYEDKSGPWLKKVEAACDAPGGALDAATQRLAAIISESMYRSGASGLPNGTPVKRQPPSAPGTPPAVKTARLAGSFTNARVGTLRWAAGTDVEYAKIQEFGGTIQHPGGTHYVMTKDGPRFITEQKALNLALSKGTPLKVTGPHSITLPARPFMRPAINNPTNFKKIEKAFNARFSQLMGAGT